ncbi:zinc-dependent metalloprotease [Hoyosella rhizosphaerae]|nr:zinc-dependent metalloprotease [Hoyosella rhizosphaerae]
MAVRTSHKLIRPEPLMSSYTRDQVRRELVELSAFAEGPVREVTGLADGLPVPQASILDRAGWAAAAAESLADLTGGSFHKRPKGLIAGRVSGAQAGAVLGFLSNAILGQYDPFAEGGGSLLLVAPNIVATERAMKVSPRDFRTWVCLHEVTHRVQFSATPWMADYMRELVDVMGTETKQQWTKVAPRLAAAVQKNRRNEQENDDLFDRGIIALALAAQPPEQRDAMMKLIILGTVLEGHAEHVMDAAGPTVVPTVDHIRRVFDQRRQRQQSPLQWIVRTLLGIDAKMAQYVQGKKFVDAVVSAVGMDKFNAIWTSPETLPTPAEIREPMAWVARVHG